MKRIIILILCTITFCSCSIFKKTTDTTEVIPYWWPTELREYTSFYKITNEYYQSVIDIIDSTYKKISDSTISTAELEQYICRMNSTIENAIHNDTSTVLFPHIMRATAYNFGETFFNYESDRFGNIECAFFLANTVPYLWQTLSNETSDMMALSLCENSRSSLARNADVILCKKDDSNTGYYGNYAAIILADVLDSTITSVVIHMYDEYGNPLNCTLGYGGVAENNEGNDNTIRLYITLDDFLVALYKSQTMTITYQTTIGEVSMTALHGKTFREQIKECPRLKSILDNKLKQIKSRPAPSY